MSLGLKTKDSPQNGVFRVALDLDMAPIPSNSRNDLESENKNITSCWLE